MPDRRTYADRAEYLKIAVAKRRKTIKAKVVEYKGKACLICGYSKCVLVCANCHREIHAGMVKVQPLQVTVE